MTNLVIVLSFVHLLLSSLSYIMVSVNQVNSQGAVTCIVFCISGYIPHHLWTHWRIEHWLSSPLPYHHDSEGSIQNLVRCVKKRNWPNLTNAISTKCLPLSTVLSGIKELTTDGELLFFGYSILLSIQSKNHQGKRV